MKTILLIEDEASIADTVVYALESEGLRCLWRPLGGEGLAVLRQEEIALVILDVGLPDGNGFEFCKAIRTFSTVPIIFLTARNHEIDRIVGLEIGADDYVSKPFSPRELAARVKVILRRGQLPGQATTPADFFIERAKGRIRYRGALLELTHYEYRILALFLQQPERIFSRGQIMDQVWSEPEVSLERAVDTHIKSLRAKLAAVDAAADPIHTHRGMGYSLSGSVHES